MRNALALLAERSNPSSDPDYEKLATTIAAATAKSVVSSPMPEKVTFSKYDGKMDALALYSWFHQFTSYFALTPKTDTQKVLLAMMHLTGDAITWKEEWVDKKMAAQAAMDEDWLVGSPLTYVWEDFRRDLMSRFLPPRYLKSLKDDYLSLSQSGKSMMFYANSVSQLGGQLRKSDDDRLETFLFGLDPTIKYDVESLEPRTFDEAVRLA